MSLYGGTDLDHDQIKPEDSTPTGSSWNSGLKLLQTHIQLKKASAAPAINRGKERTSAPSTVLLEQIRKRDSSKATVVVNQLPFISVSSTAKDSILDDFDSIEDEYNPLYPNDYERISKRKEEERRKRKDEERRRESEERRKRKSGRPTYDSSDDEDDERDDSFDRKKEMDKRHMGAAIAPPSSLIPEPQQPTDDDRPTYQPTFGSGSKGLNVAAKIMEKYGYRHGLGLGKSEQGMSTALHVEKTSWRGGKIIHERDIASRDQLSRDESSGQMADNVEPITDVLKNPTKVVLLKNMVGPGEVDEDLEPEIKEEMHKFGDVVSVVIFEIPGQAEEEAVRIFVEFPKVDQAIKAVVSLHGRFFAARAIRACFYDYDKFKNYDLAE